MKKLFTIILVAAASTMYAQFTLNGEIRPRTEFKHGYKAPQDKETMFSTVTSQRTRLGFGYKSDLYDVGIQIQDVRAWGQEKQLVVDDGAHTTIHQAWASIKFTEVLSLKVGRQELVYDDSRILGNVGWAQQARSHDLALFKMEKKDAYKLHAGFAVNQVQTDPYMITNYKSMQFLWFNKSFGDAYTLSVLALNNGSQDTLRNGKNTTTYSQIIGQRSVYKIGKLKIGVNFYYQMGETNVNYLDANNEFQKQKIGAYNLGVDLNYKLNDNIGIGGGYEMLSGNSQTETDASYNETNHAFTPLYGTNHKFNGWMDYFYVGNHKNSVGLNDAYVKISYKKNKFLSGAHVHYFMTNAEVLDVVKTAETGDVTAMSSGLGTELDLYAGYKLGKGVLLKAGMSMMFATETMHAIKSTDFDNAGANYWGWMMIVVKPTFFKSSDKK